jgi:micrococcal nuclease
VRPLGLAVTVALLVGACTDGGRAREVTDALVPDTSTTVAAALPIEANAIVTYVVDGDTVDVDVDGRDERVRLIGIDTPETKRPDTPVECFGPEATDFVTTLLRVGTPVRLERDVVGRDDFGRLLAYVFRAEDGMFVNHEIVRRGYARPLTFPPNVVYSELFVDAARAAEADDLGLWAACGQR